VNVADLKKALQQQGLQIYRSMADEVRIAERVRENLILDSGISVSTALEVIVVFRTEKRAFPGESEHSLFARARTLAGVAKAHGLSEKRTNSSEITDASNENRVLDEVFEVTYSRTADDLNEAATLCRTFLAAPRIVEP
jgi:hypothetical protein